MSKQLELSYDSFIESAVFDIQKRLTYDYALSNRSVALLLLQEDEDVLNRVHANEGKNFVKILDIINKTKAKYDKPINYILSLHRQKKAMDISSRHITKTGNAKDSASKYISNLTMSPITGIPILLLVLYFGLYKFVGSFGAGTLVDLLEESLFGKYINPWLDGLITAYIPWNWLQELLGRDFGILTLGLRYAIAIVLPIVGTFFLMFSIIEDSGYLPRLAMLVDRLFKAIGLNGRAVIPMVLGFGCDTMATMVSRTLETKRERVIATFLLSLAIPCSAQLGVILALLSGSFVAMSTWVGFMVIIFLFIGFLTAKVLPGEKPSFYMELPPIRMPKLSNVLVKTYTRLQWYFVEILPLFIIASVLIWFLNITGLFNILLDIIKPVVGLIGLPEETAQTFLFGFFRRDYGAAGLYDLQKSNLLNTRQLIVSAATLTLFVPCIAQFAMTIKERGIKSAFLMAGFIFPFAFASGFILNQVLLLFRV